MALAVSVTVHSRNPVTIVTDFKILLILTTTLKLGY